jgi:hypothetical protein
MKGPLSRSEPSADRAKAGRTGAPGRSTAWWLVERWEALRLALGARGSLAARGGYVNPASRGARWCPGASHRSIPSRSSREGNSKPRTHCAARMRKCGCLKLWIGISKRSASLTSPRACGERSTRIVRCAAGEGPGTAKPDQKTVGSKGLRLNKHDPKVRRLLTAVPRPSPEACAAPVIGRAFARPVGFGFDLSPQARGEVKKRCAASGARESATAYVSSTPCLP